MDLRRADLLQHPVELNGEWKWYWHQLRLPQQPETRFEYVAFPQLWSAGQWRKHSLPSQGFATYALMVLVPQRSEPLALEIPAQYSAHRLFLNGREVARDGDPTTSAATTGHHWATQFIEVPPMADTLRLLLQVANFQHSKGGTIKAPRLGPANQLRASLAANRSMDVFLLGCLFMSGLFLVGLFGVSRNDRAILYFGLFCLVYSYRIVGTDTYTLHAVLPNLPWLLTLRLEYLSLYGSIALFVVYTQALYPKDTRLVVIKIMTWVCMAFAVTVITLPPLWFTKLINPFLGLMVGYIGYAMHVYWLAARRKRPGATYSLVSTGLLMIVFCLITLQYFGVAMPAKVILFTGYLLFFFLQSLVLSFRFAYALDEARHTEKQFLANMSHEIRTPLNAILGFSNLLETTRLDGEQQEFVRYIRTAGSNLLTIVNDILDIAKIEAGLMPLETIPFSVQGLVDSLQTMLHQTATDKGLQLVAQIDPELPPVLLGDPTRLTQILLNLLSNAIKFTKQGSVSVRVEKQDEMTETVWVRFTVEDTGIGITADVLLHIFERFRQANDSTTRQYGGTGLGLSIVKSLAELQNGWVTVTSVPDKGSCFTVEIPYKIAPAADIHTTNQHTTAWGPSGRALRILVAEDNPMNQKLALGVLSRLGHKAQIAENGQVALQELEANEYDLVLMDIQMPIMDGYTTTYHIRNTLKNQVPIIAMTAHALASEREQCLQAGMNDFLPKPFQPQGLQQLIRKYVPELRIENEVLKSTVDAVPAESPTTDFSVEPLLAVVEGDMAFVVELLETFLEHTPPQIDELKQGMAEGNVQAVGRLIHSQKAAIKMFGLTKAIEQIQVIESLITANASPAEVGLRVEEYVIILADAIVAINNVLRTKLKHTPAS